MTTYVCFWCKEPFEREKPPKNPDRCFCKPRCASQYASRHPNAKAKSEERKNGLPKAAVVVPAAKIETRDAATVMREEYSRLSEAKVKPVKVAAHRKYPEWTIGEPVVADTTRPLGFPCHNMSGTVQRYDESGEYGWVRVNLSNGRMETFQHGEVVRAQS